MFFVQYYMYTHQSLNPPNRSLHWALNDSKIIRLPNATCEDRIDCVDWQVDLRSTHMQNCKKCVLAQSSKI